MRTSWPPFQFFTELGTSPLVGSAAILTLFFLNQSALAIEADSTTPSTEGDSPALVSTETPVEVPADTPNEPPANSPDDTPGETPTQADLPTATPTEEVPVVEVPDPEEPPIAPLPTPSPTPRPAKTEINFYSIRFLRHNPANQIYLIKSQFKQSPPTGNILLVFKEKKPFMAFRVVKNYPGSDYFAAKRVKSYVDDFYLNSEVTYVAIEKYVDPSNPKPEEEGIPTPEATQPPVAPTPQPSDPVQTADSPEAEPQPSGIPSPDPSPSDPPPIETVTEQPAAIPPEAPQGTPETAQSETAQPNSEASTASENATDPASTEPTAKAPPKPEDDFLIQEDQAIQNGQSAQDEQSADELEKLMIEEAVPFERYKHWLTAGISYVRGQTPLGGSFYFSSGGFRYGFNLKRHLFLNTPKVQDSITAETGFYLFKALNYATLGDAYSLISIPITIRYNINFSESFGVFVYGGVSRGIVLSSSQGTTLGLLALSSTLPSAGGGFLFQIGPSWYTRIDVGIDSIGAGLVLKL